MEYCSPVNIYSTPSLSSVGAQSERSWVIGGSMRGHATWVREGLPLRAKARFKVRRAIDMGTKKV